MNRESLLYLASMAVVEVSWLIGSWLLARLPTFGGSLNALYSFSLNAPWTLRSK